MREKLKLYYLCRFTQLSPLRLSGGKAAKMTAPITT